MVLVTRSISKKIPTFLLKDRIPAVSNSIQNKLHSLLLGISFIIDTNDYKLDKNGIYVFSILGIRY